MTSLKYNNPDEGVATHVYAAFDPDLKGEHASYFSSRV